jgi:hypothetical protein
MMAWIIEHIKDVAKTFVGGGVVAGGTHAAFDIAQATQYSTFAAEVMTVIYFFVVTIIAIKNRNKSPS